MSKPKKTRQQKIIADLRRKLQANHPTQQHVFALEIKKEENRQPFNLPTPKTIIIHNVFLLSDLYKTLLVTGGIIISETVLFFLLKNHIIKIPMVNF